MSPSAEWYVLGAGRAPTGPYDAEAALRALREASSSSSPGRGPEGLVWRDGMPEWRPAAETELCAGRAGDSQAAYSVAAMTYDPGADDGAGPPAGGGAGEGPAGGAGEGAATGADDGSAGARSAGAGPNPSQQQSAKAGRRGRQKEQARPAVTAVYVTGLPEDADEREVYEVFAKCGIIKQSGESAGGGFKVKLYRDEESGLLKGDALVTYLRRPSVDLALQLLDGTPLRPGGARAMVVREAVFEARGGGADGGGGQKKKVKRDRKGITGGGAKKRPRSAVQKDENSRLAWDGFDDEYPKKDVTVILSHMFDMGAVMEEYAASTTALSQTDTVDRFFGELEEDVRAEINSALRISANDESIIDVVKRVRAFRQTADGVVSVELKTPEAAARCIAIFHGRVFDGRRISAQAWDGFQIFGKRVETAEEQERRLERFADALETG